MPVFAPTYYCSKDCLKIVWASNITENAKGVNE